MKALLIFEVVGGVDPLAIAKRIPFTDPRPLMNNTMITNVQVGIKTGDLPTQNVILVSFQADNADVSELDQLIYSNLSPFFQFVEKVTLTDDVQPA